MPRTSQDTTADALDRYATMLAGLPALLETAREILVVAYGPDHEAARDLRRQIEACAVDAYRLLLAHRLEAAERGEDGG